VTDPKEKKPPIPTRTPGRLSGSSGMFDRVKLRPAEKHPIEEILAGATETQAEATTATEVGRQKWTPCVAFMPLVAAA